METVIEQMFKRDQKQHEVIFFANNMSITRWHLEAIICGALEGGSNYWYCLDTAKEEMPGTEESYSERVVEAMLNSPYFCLSVKDIETRELLGLLALDTVQKAIEKTAIEYPQYFQDLLDDDLDGSGADCIFQLAVMGELVFC